MQFNAIHAARAKTMAHIYRTTWHQQQQQRHQFDVFFVAADPRRNSIRIRIPEFPHRPRFVEFFVEVQLLLQTLAETQGIGAIGGYFLQRVVDDQIESSFVNQIMFDRLHIGDGTAFQRREQKAIRLRRYKRGLTRQKQKNRAKSKPKTPSPQDRFFWPKTGFPGLIPYGYKNRFSRSKCGFAGIKSIFSLKNRYIGL